MLMKFKAAALAFVAASPLALTELNTEPDLSTVTGKVVAGTVAIETERAQGAGFLLAKDKQNIGVIITDKHVISHEGDGKSYIKVKSSTAKRALHKSSRPTIKMIWPYCS